MQDLILEVVLLLNVLVAMKILLYVVQKLFKKRIKTKLIILLLYAAVFYNYFDISEQFLKAELDIWEAKVKSVSSVN